MSKKGEAVPLPPGAEWLGNSDPSFIFRPIHYLGSKLRVLTSIERAIDRLDPSGGPVCDLFSGSATVSRYLSRRRQVSAVDIQEYARVLAEAVLNGEPAQSATSVEKTPTDETSGIELRWAVGEHDADLEKPTGPVFSDKEKLREYLAALH